MKDVHDWIDAHADECVADLQRLVRQPSVSAQDIGLRDCAELLRDMMHADGLPAQLHELEDGPPVVYGEIASRSPKTLLCYSHYDVQPPEPIEAWRHGGPWSGAIVDGVLYGRGATDNKSGVLAFNKAAKAFLAVRGEVPVGLKLLIEGEEEIGSPNLGPWAKANADMLAADGMHCLDGALEVGVEVPDVSLGLKSVLFVELVAQGAVQGRAFAECAAGAEPGLGSRARAGHDHGPGQAHPDRGLGRGALRADARGHGIP